VPSLHNPFPPREDKLSSVVAHALAEVLALRLLLSGNRNTMSSPTSVAAHRSPKTSASLSIVVVSVGSGADLEHAIEVMTPAIRRFGAQLVVAREDDGTNSATVLRDHPKASMVLAPKGATRAQLCDVGMAAATGDIVALRDDSAVRDVSWLESLAHAIRPAEPAELAVVDYSDFSTSNAERPATIEAVRRHSALTAMLASSQEVGQKLSVPLADRRADPKRAIAREM